MPCDSWAQAPAGPAELSLKLSVAVLTLAESSLTNTDAVLLSQDVCTAMIRTQKCGLDRTHEQTQQSSRPYLFKSLLGIKRHI
jgi:hypothetical protein